MTCTKIANLTGDAKVSFQEDFDEHLRRKTLSHQKKDEDKTRANNDPSFMSVTFDLQSKLQIPSCQASLMYYMCKLCVNNLYVYQQRKPSNAYCYTWQETEAKRGAVEIGTSI
ncbi:organic cation transporter protein [Elysia marginata]|uniref:Organic cation transporter protein n=1 Tax=Elysia marginata TaxID=1093978 RepID=A0AAV4J476_9GAST|nr:organic cation transporter protein [Elysia marginata]